MVLMMVLSISVVISAAYFAFAIVWPDPDH